MKLLGWGIKMDIHLAQLQANLNTHLLIPDICLDHKLYFQYCIEDDPKRLHIQIPTIALNRPYGVSIYSKSAIAYYPYIPTESDEYFFSLSNGGSQKYLNGVIELDPEFETIGKYDKEENFLVSHKHHPDKVSSTRFRHLKLILTFNKTYKLKMWAIHDPYIFRCVKHHFSLMIGSPLYIQ